MCPFPPCERRRALRRSGTGERADVPQNLENLENVFTACINSLNVFGLANSFILSLGRAITKKTQDEKKERKAPYVDMKVLDCDTPRKVRRLHVVV